MTETRDKHPIGATGRLLQFSRTYEHEGVRYTISNDADGTVRWSFDAQITAPFRGTEDSVQGAHAAVQQHINLMKGKRP